MPLEAAARELPGKVDFLEFAAASASAPVPPAFIFGSLPSYLTPELFAEFDIPSAGCYFLRDAQVTYDAIILMQGQPLWSFALNHPPEFVAETLRQNVPALAGLPVRRIAGEAAIIHGPGFNVFGHWLIDFLPRLYLLRRAGLDIEALNFILPVGIEGFASEFLRLCGVPAENIILHDHKAEVLAPDVLVAPTILRLRSRFCNLLPVATQFWVNRVMMNAPPSMWPEADTKIFVSRSRFQGNRAMKTRGEIEARAADAGYAIVHPQHMSLQEQVQMFRSAGQIVGEYGSGLHGAVCAPAGSVVCALRGTSHHPGFAQSGLAERFGQHLGYVFGETPRHAQNQTIEIDGEMFGRALAAMEMVRGKVR
jgi:capsular polysaccharide biosynthesis protein